MIRGTLGKVAKHMCSIISDFCVDILIVLTDYHYITSSGQVLLWLRVVDTLLPREVELEPTDRLSPMVESRAKAPTSPLITITGSISAKIRFHFKSPTASDCHRLATEETTTQSVTPYIYGSFPMAQDMHAHSWRSRVAAHLAPMKEYLPYHQHHHHLHPHPNHHNLATEASYVDGEARKPSWSQFASRMFAKRSFGDPDVLTSSGTERIVLLPGWASRRYRDGPALPGRAGTSHFFLF
jgi:hypothetical protein